MVVPVRHSYLTETLHGARTVLERAGVRMALHLAPQASGAERPWWSGRWRTGRTGC